jgi:LAGLIDADG endonuclease
VFDSYYQPAVRGGWEHVFVAEGGETERAITNVPGPRREALRRPPLAGLVAGEGSFGIHPNNGGQSWACAFSLNLRDDDSPLLQQMQETLGCGSLYTVAAQGHSRPQVAWVVQRMADCRKLAAWLTGLPLLVKKAGDFEIWAAAVEAWHDVGSARRRWAAMAALAERLRRHRGPQLGCDFTQVDITQRYLEEFFSGFATAEAHFGATGSGHPIFVINLHADDEPLLALLQYRFEVGVLETRLPQGTSGPGSSWRVSTLSDVSRLLEIFERCPPYGRSARTFEAWRDLVRFVCARRGEAHAAKRRALAMAIREARAYRPPDPLPTRDQARERRERYVRVLHTWQAVSQPPFTTTSYDRARRELHPEWPSRNTLSRVFGSWRSALEAAGLPLEGARSPITVGRIRAANTRAHTDRQAAWRTALAETILACYRELGPGLSASDFFRWRLRFAPSSPTQATLYRLFPGGWREALEAALAAETT